MKVTVIGGLGFVGSAMTQVFREGGIDVDCIDKKVPKTEDLYANVYSSDVVFIAVPTPYSPRVKECYDYSILGNVLFRRELEQHPAICIRSTITPDFFSYYAPAWNAAAIYHPEFLSAKTAVEDFRAGLVHIYGGTRFGYNCSDVERTEQRVKEATERIQMCYRECGIIPKFELGVGLVEAVLLKLMHNAYGAMNVAFANEMSLTCNVWSGSLSWQAVGTHLAGVLDTLDRRFAKYKEVPGPDGKRGYGGRCFPKDILALLSYMKQQEVPHKLIEGVIHSNNEVRLPE